MHIPEIEPNDLHYYSDMSIYEFTAANRALFERLGAKDWDQCVLISENIFADLPSKPRPYERNSANTSNPLAQRVKRRHVWITGEAVDIIEALATANGKNVEEMVNLLIIGIHP